MIDHVSVPVRDLAASAAFYERVLAPLGYTRLVERPATVGFGKKYPEFWLNLRARCRPSPPTPACTCACARQARTRCAPSTRSRSSTAAAATASPVRARRR